MFDGKFMKNIQFWLLFERLSRQIVHSAELEYLNWAALLSSILRCSVLSTAAVLSCLGFKFARPMKSHPSLLVSLALYIIYRLLLYCLPGTTRSRKTCPIPTIATCPLRSTIKGSHKTTYVVCLHFQGISPSLWPMLVSSSSHSRVGKTTKLDVMIDFNYIQITI